MALFDKLFGSNKSPKLRLIRELTRFRIKTDPSAPFMGIDSSQVDSLTDGQLLMLPEASIATIVETYIQLVRRGASPQSAILQIDDHRSSGFGSVRSSETTNIFDYVADRMRIEHEQAGALDQAFIDSAVFTSAKVFGMDIELPKRPPYEVIKEFFLSIFRVVIAKYTRRDDGYLYPWRLMAFDSRTEAFAFSYNLEVSPITCGLGSHIANGVHLTFEEGDPDMSLDDFEAWAIPMAIDHIYGDQVLTEQEAHAFGVKVVADYLGTEGMDVLSISKEPQRDPQIYAMKEGRTVAIVVRVAAYPKKGVLDEESEEIGALIDDCDSKDHELFFASVGLSNSNARNDYERAALLRNGSFHVAFSGLEMIV